MRLPRLLALTACLGACSKPPPPAPPPPPPAPVVVVDAGAPARRPVEPDAVEAEEQLPQEEKWNDHSIDGPAFEELLVKDPDRASRLLEELHTPDVWQVSLVAQLALARGVSGPAPVPEGALPELPLAHPAPDDATQAFVGNVGLPLRATAVARGPSILALPIGTSVTVLKRQGKFAQVEVLLAKEVDYAVGANTPERVVTEAKRGFVEARWLSAELPKAEELEAEAMARPETERGLDEALALLERALWLGRSEETRARMVHLGFKAHRAVQVAEGALARFLVTPSSVRFAWGCRGDPSRAKWLSFGRGQLPRVVPADLCLTDVDVAPVCEGAEHDAERKKFTARTEALEKAGLRAGPVLEAVVDASRPHRLFLFATPLAAPEPCDTEETLELMSAGTRLRRLMLPLGTRHTIVRVHLPEATWEGHEVGVLGAGSDAKAVNWLRERGTYHWAVDPETHELTVALGPQDLGFHVQHDVVDVSRVRAPRRACGQCPWRPVVTHRKGTLAPDDDAGPPRRPRPVLPPPAHR